MIFIIDKIEGWSLGIGEFQAKIIEFIEKCQKCLDDEMYPPEKQAKLHDAIMWYQSQLRYLTEMQKVPFDVMLIIEKEALSETWIIDDFSDDLSTWAPTQE